MLAYDRNKILTFYKEAKDCFAKGMCVPRTALVYPSRACNQHCYFCSDIETNQNMHSRTMDKALLLSLPKQIKDLGGEAVELCGGGEPFLHSNIKEFIWEAGITEGLKLGTLTNGTMLKGELADIVAQNFSFVRISMDSFNNDTYSKMRGVPLTGPNSLEQVLKNIDDLIRFKRESNSNLLITLKAVFSKTTLQELPSYIHHALKLDIDGINIKLVRNTENEISPDEIEEFYTTYLEHVKKNNIKGKPYVFGSLTNSTLTTPICFACNFHVFIDTDGTLRICCYYQNRRVEHSYGKVTTNNLEELWNSQIHKEAVKNIDGTKCNLYNCKYHGFNEVLYDGIIEDKGQWQFT